MVVKNKKQVGEHTVRIQTQLSPQPRTPSPHSPTKYRDFNKVEEDDSSLAGQGMVVQAGRLALPSSSCGFCLWDPGTALFSPSNGLCEREGAQESIRPNP